METTLLFNIVKHVFLPFIILRYNDICCFILISLVIIYTQLIKIKNKKYHPVGTITKSNVIIVERGKIDTTTTQIRDLSLVWCGTGTSLKSGGVKLVLRAEPPPPHPS